MRRFSLVLACALALLAIGTPADAQAVRPPAAVADARREAVGPIRIAAPVPADAGVRAVADSVLAEAMGGEVETDRANADIYGLSKHVGIGMALGAVVGLAVGAIVLERDDDFTYGGPLLILYTGSGAVVGMVGGAIVYFVRGGDR